MIKVRAESGDLAAQIAAIAADIRADLLPTDPAKAKILAEKLFSLDEVVFERADDSGGSIGSELRDACVLWLDAAAATSAAESDTAHAGSRFFTSFIRKAIPAFRSPC